MINQLSVYHHQSGPPLGDCGVGTMARRPPNDGASWSARELKTLKALAKAGTPTGQVARASWRPVRLGFSRKRCARASPSERRSAPEPGERSNGMLQVADPEDAGLQGRAVTP